MNERDETTYQAKLSELRNQLNAVDEDLIKLLISRFSLTNEIGKLKQNYNQQVYDADREAYIIQKVSETIRNNYLTYMDLDSFTNCIIKVYREIMNQSKINQLNV